MSLEVVLNRVVDFQVFNVSAPCTSSESTLCSGLACFLRHGGRDPAASRAAIGRDSVVEGWTGACSTAHVETSGWVATIDDGDSHGSLLSVRVLHGAVHHFRLEGVRRRCNVSDLVGDVAGAGLAAVVAGAEGETTPSVGGGGPVDHVVGRSTSVGADGAVEVVPTVGGDTQSVSGGCGLRGVPRERAEVAGDVAWDSELVGLGVSVGDTGRGLAATGEWRVNTGFGVDTNGSPCVLGAVVHEDQVQAWTVFGTNPQVAITVVVPKVLVELVCTAVHAVVTIGWCDVSTCEPVTVEGAGARVETGR